MTTYTKEQIDKARAKEEPASDELLYQRGGRVVEYPDWIEVILKGYRDSTLQSQAQAACQRVNERRVIMPDDRLLRMRVSNPPDSNFQIC